MAEPKENVSTQTDTTENDNSSNDKRDVFEKQFSTGYSKGIEKGKKDILKELSESGKLLNDNEFEEYKEFLSIKQKKAKNEVIDKTEFEKVKAQYDLTFKQVEKYRSLAYRELIDNKLKTYLADKVNPEDIEDVTILIKNMYKIHIDEKEDNFEIQISKDGKPIIDVKTEKVVETLEQLGDFFLREKPKYLRKQAVVGSGTLSLPNGSSILKKGGLNDLVEKTVLKR